MSLNNISYDLVENYDLLLRNLEPTSWNYTIIPVTRLTFASFLHVGAVVGSSQHGHRIATVLSGEAVLEAPGQLVVEHMEGKLWNKQHQVSKSRSVHVDSSE